MAIFIYSANPKNTGPRPFCQPKYSTTSASSGTVCDVLARYRKHSHKTASKNDENDV